MKTTKPQPSAIKHWEVEKLKFDPLNPRWPNYLEKGDEASVFEWMLEEANILELMTAIGEQGYFEGEPLIVVPSKAHKGCFDVVEGNRRLTAVKLLLNPQAAPVKKTSVQNASDGAKHKPTKLPVLEFQNRGDVLRYLAYRHITGVEPWNPLQKARYLKQLAVSPVFKKLTADERRRQLAREIGSNPNYVSRLLTGLAVYELIADQNSFFQIPGLDERTISYAVLTTALTYPNLAKYIGLESVSDDDVSKIKKVRLEELTRWMFEKNSEGQTRLGESRNLQKLARVVITEKALSKFKTGTPLAEADLLTSGPTEAFRNSIRDAKSRLETARDCVHLIEKHAQEDADLLKEIQRLTRLLVVHVDDNLVNPTKGE